MTRIVVIVSLVALVAIGLRVKNPFAPTLPDNVAAALSHNRRVLVLGNAPQLTLASETPSRALAQTLAQPWDVHTLDALRGLRIDAILVGSGEHPENSAAAALQSGRTPEGLRAVVLSRAWKVYIFARSFDLRHEYREATAYIARRILAGAATPNATSFPEELRRIHNCEVVVTLREGERARLWRSAKGSSIARALTTAAVVARQRWVERETSMGESLENALKRMSVEVSVIEEDGTLLTRDDAFLDDVARNGYGIGFESTGLWRYVLPNDVAEKGAPAGRGEIGRAFRALFESEEMPADSQQKPTVRLYRFNLRILGVSSPRQETEVEAQHARLGG